VNFSFFSILIGVLTVYFGIRLLQIIPTLLPLLTALFTQRVTWPGPRIHETKQSATVVRGRLGVDYQSLFFTFIWSTLSATGAFVYFLLTFIIYGTSLLSGYVVIKSTWIVYFATLMVFIAGRVAFDCH